jgi:glutaredoxin-related protein
LAVKSIQKIGKEGAALAKQIVVYGSLDCPDAMGLLERFDEAGIAYTNIDILDSLYNLKAFLDVRDANQTLFDLGEEVGIPTVVIDDKTVIKVIEDVTKMDLKIFQ